MDDFENILLEISKNNLDAENKRYKDINTRAIGIITICGILITLLMNFEKSQCTISKILFLFAALLFLITVILSIRVITPREVKSLSTKILIDFYKNKPTENQISGIIQTAANAEDLLMNTNDTKAKELDKAIYTLGIGVILMILYAMFSIIFL